MSTDGRLTRALGTRDLAVYYLSSLVGVGVLVVPGIALAKAGPASLLAWVILSFEQDSARLTAEYGITVGRWEQYLGTEGKLPFGAMWSIVPAGGVSAEDHHEELELAVVLSGDGEVESTGTGDRRPTPVGTAALMDSYERHVWHNRSADAPLVFLSIYWMPLDQLA